MLYHLRLTDGYRAAVRREIESLRERQLTNLRADKVKSEQIIFTFIKTSGSILDKYILYINSSPGKIYEQSYFWAPLIKRLLDTSADPRYCFNDVDKNLWSDYIDKDDGLVKFIEQVKWPLKEHISDYALRRETTVEGIQSQAASFLAFERKLDELKDAVDRYWNRIFKLIRKLVNLTGRDENGRSAIHHAGSSKLASLLLDRGAYVNAKDEDLATALHYAARDGNPALVRILLQKGADINAADILGATALHYALMGCPKKVGGRNISKSNSVSDRETTIRLLLIYGADPNADQDHGCKPIHYGIQLGSKDMISTLIHFGAKVDVRTRPSSRTWCGSDELLLFFGRGYSKMPYEGQDTICPLFKTGLTPLHIAAVNFNINFDLVRLLLRPDADLDVKDSEGFTALARAIYINDTALVRLLLQEGSDINLIMPSPYFSPSIAREIELQIIKLKCLKQEIREDISTIINHRINGNYGHLYPMLDNVGGNDENQNDYDYDDHDTDDDDFDDDAEYDFEDGYAPFYHEGNGEYYGMHMYPMYVPIYGIGRLIREQRQKHDQTLENNCKLEFESLIRYKLKDGITLQDIMLNKYPNYLKNKSLLINIDAFDYKQFPVCGTLIRRKITRDKVVHRTKQLARPALEAISAATLKSSRLSMPYELISKILDNYLNKDDLEILGHMWSLAKKRQPPFQDGPARKKRALEW